MSRSLLALATLVVTACCSPLPEPVCATISIGNTKINNSKIQKFELRPIRLNGVPGGGADITLQQNVPATRTLVGEKVKVCDILSKKKPGVVSKLGYFNIEVFANVPWPGTTNLVVYAIQYGKLKST